jgi:hypothetical protein
LEQEEDVFDLQVCSWFKNWIVVLGYQSLLVKERQSILIDLKDAYSLELKSKITMIDQKGEIHFFSTRPAISQLEPSCNTQEWSKNHGFNFTSLSFLPPLPASSFANNGFIIYFAPTALPWLEVRY